MKESGDTFLQHFPIMIIASLVLFYIVILVVLGRKEFYKHFYLILYLSIVVVVVGMLFGKYGATFGLKWWIYYPIPMLMNVILPPLALKMNVRKTTLYLVLSFLSAPAIHFFFSFFFNWTEYMPFWEIPYFKSVLN